MLPFRNRLSLHQRKKEYDRISSKLEGYVPAILEKRGRLDPKIDKGKFLMPYDLTMAQLSYVVRKRINVSKNEAVFLFVDNKLLSGNETVKKIYDSYKSEDNFLYIVYTLENTFG